MRAKSIQVSDLAVDSKSLREQHHYGSKALSFGLGSARFAASSSEIQARQSTHKHHFVFLVVVEQPAGSLRLNVGLAAVVEHALEVARGHVRVPVEAGTHRLAVAHDERHRLEVDGEGSRAYEAREVRGRAGDEREWVQAARVGDSRHTDLEVSVAVTKIFIVNGIFVVDDRSRGWCWRWRDWSRGNRGNWTWRDWSWGHWSRGDWRDWTWSHWTWGDWSWGDWSRRNWSRGDWRRRSIVAAEASAARDDFFGGAKAGERGAGDGAEDEAGESLHGGNTSVREEVRSGMRAADPLIRSASEWSKALSVSCACAEEERELNGGTGDEEEPILGVANARRNEPPTLAPIQPTHTNSHTS